VALTSFAPRAAASSLHGPGAIVNYAETFLLVRFAHCAGCDSSTSNRW